MFLLAAVVCTKLKEFGATGTGMSTATLFKQMESVRIETNYWANSSVIISAKFSEDPVNQRKFSEN